MAGEPRRHVVQEQNYGGLHEVDAHRARGGVKEVQA